MRAQNMWLGVNPTNVVKTNFLLVELENQRARLKNCGIKPSDWTIQQFCDRSKKRQMHAAKALSISHAIGEHLRENIVDSVWAWPCAVSRVHGTDLK